MYARKVKRVQNTESFPTWFWGGTSGATLVHAHQIAGMFVNERQQQNPDTGVLPSPKKKK
jgi:hypothetical protein